MQRYQALDISTPLFVSVLLRDSNVDQQIQEILIEWQELPPHVQSQLFFFLLFIIQSSIIKYHQTAISMVPTTPPKYAYCSLCIRNGREPCPVQKNDPQLRHKRGSHSASHCLLLNVLVASIDSFRLVSDCLRRLSGVNWSPCSIGFHT